jgi:hypothetical protein
MMARSSPDIEDAIYQRVAEELLQNQLDPAIMAKAAARAQGNSELAKSLYIQFRAEQISKQTAEASEQKRRAAARRAKEAADATRAAAVERQMRQTRQFAIRWGTRLAFIVCQGVVAAVYWIGSGLAFVDKWPGLVNIPRGMLVSSFLWSFFGLAAIGFVLWLPVLGVRKAINSKKSYSPYVFVVIVSLVIGLLDMTKTIPLFSGTEGWGPWDGLKKTMNANGGESE